MFNPHEIDLRAPVEPGHPLNRGRRLWLLGHPYLAGGRTWYDLCGRANGALTNGPAWAATGRGDAGLSLDGTDDQVRLPNAAATVFSPFDCTLAAWVRLPAGSPKQMAAIAAASSANANNHIALAVDVLSASWRLRPLIRNSVSNGGYSTATLPAGRWIRLVATCDGVNLRGYADGVLLVTTAVTTTIPTPGFLTVGAFRQAFTTTAYWEGDIADSTVVARAWSASDVALDYDLSRRGYPGEYGPLRRVSNRGFLLLREADAGGGTAYEEAYASSITATGALTHVVSKAVAGSETGTGSLAKLAAKPLAGSATAAGDLARSTAKSMAGGLTGSGTVAKAASKATAGSTMPAGSVTRQAAKPLAGSTTPAGSVTLLRAALLAVAGSLTAAGALARAAWKSLAGLVTGAGGLTTSGGSGPPAPTPRVLTGTWAVPTLTGTWEARSLTGTWE